MMPFLVLIAACVSFLLYLWILDRQKSKAYQRGRKDGYEEGLKDGRILADNWWIGAEAEADRARVKIWREEEPKKGAEERWS